ncbi:hypothetical protein AB1N83_012853 [Pleurotus pulmonarius]
MPLLWGWKERLGDLRVVYGDQAPHASSHLTTSTSLSLLQQRDMVYGRHLSCDDQSRPSGLVLYQLGRLAWPRQHDMLPCLPFPNVEKSEVRGHQPPATAQRRFNVLLRFSGMDPGGGRKRIKRVRNAAQLCVLNKRSPSSRLKRHSLS